MLIPAAPQIIAGGSGHPLWQIAVGGKTPITTITNATILKPPLKLHV